MTTSARKPNTPAHQVIDALTPRPVTNEEFARLLDLFQVVYVDWKIGTVEVWEVLEPAREGYELGLDLMDRYEKFGSTDVTATPEHLRKITVECGRMAGAAAVTCFLLGWMA